MPSIVKNSSPKIKRFHICTQGNRHAGQPLSIVCLDPICRNNPLICPTCFSEYHKYHKTIPLNKFMSDYQGAVHRNHKQSAMRRFSKEHEAIRKSVREFRSKVIEKLTLYEDSIEEYFTFLYNSLDIREHLSKTLHISLQPQQIIHAHSQEQIQGSLSFIINYSLFNEQNKLMNVSNVLKYDESRSLALLDNVVNQNLKCQTLIQLELKKLDFAKETLGKQSIRIQNLVKDFNKTKISQFTNEQPNLSVDSKAFVQKQTFYSTLNSTKDQKKPTHTDNLLFSKLNDCFSSEEITKTERKDQTPLFVFSNVYKHEKLTIVNKERQSTIRSNVTALKPQYALICPSVDYQPLKEQNWSIRINSCRNFASSKNTLAVGLCSLNEVECQNFQESGSHSMKHQYMLTSQGLMIKNGREQRCGLTFCGGDVLDLKYDPYYKLLTIRKENGKKVTMKVGDSDGDEKLYGCVRLTYASDQVQVLNHVQDGQH